MRRLVLTLTLIGALIPGQPLAAEQLTEDDFDDHGTGLVLRPMDGVEPEPLDGPSNIIRKAPTAPEPAFEEPEAPPAPRPEPPKAKTKITRKVTGKSLVQPDGKQIKGKGAVTKLELALILDRYLDFVKQQKAEIEEKMETMPIQKGLPSDAVAKLDRLLADLDNLSAEEVNLAKMVKDLSGTVHEQGVEIHKLKIADMLTDRRLERLESATGLAKNAKPLEELTPEEKEQADKLVERVQRLEDLLYQSLSQLAEATTRLEAVEKPATIKIAARTGDPKPGRIPFAAAGGITLGAEREAYRRKLLQRVKQSIAEKHEGDDEQAAPAPRRKAAAPAPAVHEDEEEAPAAPVEDAAPASDEVASTSDYDPNQDYSDEDISDVEAAKGE